MTGSDIWALGALEIALIAFAANTFKHDLADRRAGGSGFVVTRGKESMLALYTVYGAAIASSLVLIDNAVGIEGHAVALILINFSCLTYLFFFSTQFRNQVFFPVKKRIVRD